MHTLTALCDALEVGNLRGGGRIGAGHQTGQWRRESGTGGKTIKGLRLTRARIVDALQPNIARKTCT